MYQEEEFNKQLGAALKAERLAKGETIRSMAEKMGLNHTTIYYYENGRNTISASVFKQYCNCLGISMSEFMAKYFE